MVFTSPVFGESKLFLELDIQSRNLFTSLDTHHWKKKKDSVIVFVWFHGRSNDVAEYWDYYLFYLVSKE